MKNVFTLCFLVVIALVKFHACHLKQEIVDSREDRSLVELETPKIIKAMSGSSMTALAIEAGEFEEAHLKFGSLNDFYSFTVRGRYKDFSITHLQRPVISINKENDMMIFSSQIVANKGVQFNGQIKVRGVGQWRLVAEEDFSVKPTGWTNNTISECGGISMLGGYCHFGGGEVEKNFTDLPPHTSLRIEATYHFIDAWDTESGFMRVNNGKDGEMQYLWVDRYSAFVGNNGINVCGGRWPEGRFAAPIDVTIPHKSNSIRIGFGSTIEQDPCDESFGVSGLRIYIR